MDKNKYCVVMSGGIGSRFWPASREAKPKQFLDFFGTGQTLLRMTFERFRNIIPLENFFIVTSDKYKDLTLRELPELSESQILLEPMRRNTAPCIAYAAYHIYALNPNANIVVAPADHVILKEDQFQNTINQGLDFVKDSAALLTLGIHPTRPETGYGYIQQSDDELNGVSKVKAFTEKPNLELAKTFIESGEFLWNSGIFLWNVNTIIKAFEEHLPDISAIFEKGKSTMGTNKEQGFINEVYSFCPNISIDFGILEKARNVYVLGANFGWSDVGTWGSLHELSDKDEQLNAVINENALLYNSSGNIINISKDKLAVIQGLEDYIIVESDNVFLICKKGEEQRIREFVTDAKLKFDNKFI